MFTKRHYEAIARAIRQSETKIDLVANLMEIFKMDNSNFDSTKFLEACGEGTIPIPR